MSYRWGGRVGAQNFFASSTYLAIGPVPTINAFASALISGTAFTIAGSNFEASQAGGAAQLLQGAVTVELTESSWSAASISIAALDVFATTLRFGTVTARVRNNTGNTGTRDVTLQPPAGVVYFDLLAINTTAAYRLSSTPDLVIGEQVAHQNKLFTDSLCTTPAVNPTTSGNYGVAADSALDGSFAIAIPPNGTYYFRAWRRRSDTGAWESAVQTVVVAIANTGAGASTESGSDTSYGFGGVSNLGSGASTEGARDTSSGSGTPIVTGAGASTESGQDVSTSAVPTPITGFGSSSESGSDNAAGAGPGAAATPTNLSFAIGPRYMTVKVASRGGRPIRQAKYIHEQILGEQLVYSVDWTIYVEQSGLQFHSFVASIADGDAAQILATEQVGNIASLLLDATTSGTVLVQVKASIGVESDIFTFEVDVYGPTDE